METTAQFRIVVGVLDAPEAEQAVRWAAGHAQRVGASLHLVHAMVWSEMGVATDPVPGIAGSGMGAAAESLVADFADIAREVAPQVPVTTAVIEGNATGVLVGASRDADLVVVGSRGLGRLAALVIGSKSIALAARAHCPVVIVRGEIDTVGPVGLLHDDREAVVRRAADLAATYGVGIEVIVGADTDDQEAAQILRRTRDTVASVRPDVEVTEVTVPVADGARHLIRACEGTSLVVAAASPEAGGQGRGGVSQRISTVLRYANTPVWIERATTGR